MNAFSKMELVTHQASGRNMPPPQNRKMLNRAAFADSTSTRWASASSRPSSSSIGILTTPQFVLSAPTSIRCSHSLVMDLVRRGKSRRLCRGNGAADMFAPRAKSGAPLTCATGGGQGKLGVGWVRGWDSKGGRGRAYAEDDAGVVRALLALRRCNVRLVRVVASHDRQEPETNPGHASTAEASGQQQGSRAWA